MIRHRIGFVALWLCASTAVVLPQQQPLPLGLGAMSGMVTDGQTKLPITGALVQLVPVTTGPGGVPLSRPRQMTDRSGRFLFQQLPAGSYSVRITAPGYLDGGYGRVPGSLANGRITLQDRQWFGDANATLWKPASIAGTIHDERGEPLVDVPVHMYVAFGVAGRDRWASAAVTKTDDRGAYRFAGLLPGRYVVHVPNLQVTLPDGAVALYQWTKVEPLPVIRASDGVGTMAGHFAAPPSGRGQVYPATFFPAARSIATAGVIALDFGNQRSAVDVSLTPVSSVRVSGVVVGPTAAIANLPVRLLAVGNELLGFGSETALTKTDTSGRFTLAHVPQGDYTIRVGRALNEIVDRGAAYVPAGLAPTSANPFPDRISGASIGGDTALSLSATAMSGDDVSGRVSITVGNDAVDGVMVPTHTGVTISGRALFDGANAPADGRAGGPFGPNVHVDPADGDITRTSNFSSSEVRPPGAAFSIRNVMPGHYRLTDGGNRNYRLVGATWHGQDLFATPLDVIGDAPVTDIVIYLSSKKNSVSGAVRASNEQVSAGAVFIFPQDRERWKEPGISAVLFRSLDVSLTGAFTTESLIPGDYFIAAVPFEDRRRLLDLEFLKLLTPQAKRITLDESATLTMDLHIVRVR